MAPAAAPETSCDHRLCSVRRAGWKASNPSEPLPSRRSGQNCVGLQARPSPARPESQSDSSGLLCLWPVRSMNGSRVRSSGNKVKSRSRVSSASTREQYKLPQCGRHAWHSRRHGQEIAQGWSPPASSAMIRCAWSPRRASRRCASTRRSVSTAINGTLDSCRSAHAAPAKCTRRAGRGCSGHRLSDRVERSGSALAEHLARGAVHLQRQRAEDIPSSGRGAWLE